ncbi:hypothetical protein LXL04_039891 [Taraxacum kok-saghyz]
MEFYTGIHEPQDMEDLIDEEIEHGSVTDDVEDTENYQEIEHGPVTDDSPLKDTCNDHHLVIAGQDFWIPTVPEKIKPEEKACYPSREAIEELYYTYARAAGFDVRKNTEKKNGLGVVQLKYLLFFTSYLLQYRMIICIIL